MAAEEAIIAKNLVKRYGDFEAVKGGISFTVKRGGRPLHFSARMGPERQRP
ncbi:hypothetical protein [Thermococcus peptonophilus]|uniref:hypothetical protein n=1 Tax=Thermococcus peptonophilus TaxID=53952 RepID=UPI000AB256B2